MDVSFAGYDIFQYSAWFDPSVSDAAIDQMRRPFWSEVVVSVGARVKGDVATLLGAGKNCTALWKRLMVKLMNYSIWLSLTYFVEWEFCQHVVYNREDLIFHCSATNQN